MRCHLGVPVIAIGIEKGPTCLRYTALAIGGTQSQDPSEWGRRPATASQNSTGRKLRSFQQANRPFLQQLPFH